MFEPDSISELALAEALGALRLEALVKSDLRRGRKLLQLIGTRPMSPCDCDFSVTF
jgi:hypothetical protein